MTSRVADLDREIGAAAVRDNKHAHGANGLCGIPWRPRPVRVMQFGEGNFLRCFVDWMVDVANEAETTNAGIIVVQPIPEGRIDLSSEQEGLYTTVLRGVGDKTGETEHRIVTAVQDWVNPYEDWARFLSFARLETVRWLVSNTTEAGIVYEACDFPANEPPPSFPAKVSAFLYERFRYFSGSELYGCIALPCELSEGNGDSLRNTARRHAADWGLPEAFFDWLDQCNVFLNTLVVRVVPGYPRHRMFDLEQHLGYRDRLLVEGERFHSWIIEDPDGSTEDLRLEDADLNVKRVHDLAPYRELKVRILNGAHTGIGLAALLGGVTTVDEMVKHPVFGSLLNKFLFDEVVPHLQAAEHESVAYARTVLARFANRAIRHHLDDIALNSVSKYAVRVMPSLLAYYRARGEPPVVLCYSVAALIAFYRGKKKYNASASYRIRDDEAALKVFSDAWSSFQEHGCYGDVVARVSPLLMKDEQMPSSVSLRVSMLLEQIDRNGVLYGARDILQLD